MRFYKLGEILLTDQFYSLGRCTDVIKAIEKKVLKGG